MRAVIQRVKNASVKVNKKTVGEINTGLLVLLAVHRDDNESTPKMMAEKIIKLRIFSDDNGKMNLSVRDIAGELLVVSQFTLYGDTKKGNRPGFSGSADPEKGLRLVNDFVSYLEEQKLKTETGVFGANMEVSLINDGPVTFIIDM